MTFDWPWSLLGILAVAAVAAWALFRPDRHLVNVGSLALWQRAIERLGGGASRRRGRISASWLLLLLGTMAAIMAASRPVWQVQRPARFVTLAIYPAAELSGKGGIEELTSTATTLLDKLSPDDRVQIFLPLQTSADASRWLSVAQAREAVKQIEILPVAAKDLTLPPPGETSQHIYAIVPAVLDLPAGPGRDVIALSTHLPPVTLESFSAVSEPNGKTQLFLSFRNTSQTPQPGPPAIVRPLSEEEPAESFRGTVPPGVHSREAELPDAPAYWAGGTDNGEYLGANAYLVRRERSPRKVAMVGRDEPLIRRYIRADRELELVADAKDADLVIAIAAQPPAGKPAIVFCPPSPPPTFREGVASGPVNLSQADVAAGDPVMKDMDAARLAVRVLRPWIVPNSPALKVLLAYKGDAVIVRTTPENADEAVGRQIFVAIDPAESNTNFAMERSFVIFMANATSWLGGGARTAAARVTYESITPLQAGQRRDWTRVVPEDHAKLTLLPMPGIYKDSAGVLHAVSLTGLKGTEAKVPSGEQIAALKLPAPRTAETRVELWTAFLAAAILLWLAGWAMRLR